MRGYGRIIIIKHSKDFFTVYAHNKENRVRRGERVKSGEVIALVGGSGNATGYHLHFEVRKGKTIRNPLFFLP
jgi:murein DD-endopeptidase MepM/ murein hydrolase activator NlpD